MRILGIDPGSHYTGYGIIDKLGNRLVHIGSGRLDVHGPTGTLPIRLEAIYAGLMEVIHQHQPEAAAIEGVFYHRNAASALTLGHARGVAMLACQHGGLSLNEYPPTVVKQAVTGSGRAQKEQVQQMVRVILALGPSEMPLDQSDALAIAICHANRLSIVSLSPPPPAPKTKSSPKTPTPPKTPAATALALALANARRR
jgi:crossover junction endodeoxyribonuclease RuvC